MGDDKDIDLVVACGRYEEVRPLAEGEVRVPGCRLKFVALQSGEMYSRAFDDPEFNVAELSLANYLTRRIRGDCPYIAIPVYVSRSFRHGTLYVREGSDIRRPADLRGRRVGIGGYGHTAFVWARGLLQHEYGVHPSEVRWVSVSHGAHGHGESVQPPPGVSIEHVQSALRIDELLAAGAIDALFATRTPSADKVVRLWKDFAKVEDDYYRRTRIFPTLHIMGLRAQLLELRPDLAQVLYRGFVEAKNVALETRRKAAALPSAAPALTAQVNRMTDLMGSDYCSYGAGERDRATLQAFLQYHHEQGLSARQYKIADLFAPFSPDSYPA